jgi:hypothetical protein
MPWSQTDPRAPGQESQLEFSPGRAGGAQGAVGQRCSYVNRGSLFSVV